MTAARARSNRSRLIRLVHTGCRVLGIDDHERQAIQLAATGRESLTEMRIEEIDKVLAELRRRGFVPLGGQRTGTGSEWSDHLPPVPAVSKLRAMWLSLWHLGCIDDVSDDALLVFVRRQTNLSSGAWADGAAISSCIEALKSWLARPVSEGGGGVRWNIDGRSTNPRLAVYHAALVLLGFDDLMQIQLLDIARRCTDAQIDHFIHTAGSAIRELPGRRH